MKSFKAKILKCFLTGIFTLCVCAFLSAQTSSYIYITEGGLISGEEYLLVSNTPEEEKTPSKLESSPYVYISENTLIAGEEHVYAEQDLSRDLQKNTAEKQIDKVKNNKTVSSPENSIAEKKPKAIILAIPFTPTPLSFLYCDKESATITSQHRLGGHQLILKINRENIFADIEHVYSALYSPEQRHKFSAIATQCGVLTSFGPNSPACA